MDESSSTQNRQSQRSKVLMAATIEAKAGLFGVTLRNLSVDGALIEGEQIPSAGSPVIFRKNELTVSGKVAWVSQGRAGIAFDAKLKPEMVLRHIPAPKQRVDPDFKRPPLKHALSPQERRWCETHIWERPLPSLEG